MLQSPRTHTMVDLARFGLAFQSQWGPKRTVFVRDGMNLTPGFYGRRITIYSGRDVPYGYVGVVNPFVQVPVPSRQHQLPQI